MRAGIDVVAALDFDPKAIETLKENLGEPNRTRKRIPYVLRRDLTEFSPEQLHELIGPHITIDLIIGGPPCQGFSLARRRDGANHGTSRLVEDPRRHLYKEFLRYVDYFQPRVFIMENVLGIRTAAGGDYFDRVCSEIRQLSREHENKGYRMKAQIEDAYKLGVPQKRRRQLFIGIREDLPGFFPKVIPPATRARVGTNLNAALVGLPELEAGEGDNATVYSNRSALRERLDRESVVNSYLRDVLEVDPDGDLYNHVARPHSERDLEDFLKLAEGMTSADAMRENIEMKYPYDRTSFKDRYTRQSRNKPCSTIVAHLAKDGLMFIHPTQNRSLTPREAARIQSFPDWFVFPEARTHSFRMIGNAVPPLVAEAVALAVRKFLGNNQPSASKETSMGEKNPIPKNAREASRWIAPLLDMTPQELRKLPAHDFLQAWCAIFYLCPGLHPDETDHGTLTEQPNHRNPPQGIDERLLGPCFTRSGWPVVLKDIVKEAWRRYNAGALNEEEMYPHAAQMAGMTGSG